MKHIISIALLCLLAISMTAAPLASNGVPPVSPGQRIPATPAQAAMLSNQQLCFVENAGQVTDQDGHQRKDIDYKIAVPGMNVFIGQCGMHYMLSSAPKGSGEDSKSIDLYRLDVQLLGANQHAGLIAEEMQEFKEIYYQTNKRSGIVAHSCRKLIYKNIYPHIDWVFHITNNKLEYDFVVRPGGRVADIRLAYGGAANLAVSKDGLAAATPMGTITEHQPHAYQQENHKTVTSQFVLRNNVVSINTDAYAGTLVIDPDPVLDWATYYGGNAADNFYGVKFDASNNVYAVGGTQSSNNIATTGSYQSTFNGSFVDAMLVKFNSVGARQWATYYGSGFSSQGFGIDCDAAGNVYMTGLNNPSGPLSAGDVFLVKFDGSGVRQWDASLAGSGREAGQAVACDGVGNVYITGYTFSSGLATTGSHQPIYGAGGDAFLAKYDNTGTLLWATYFGGIGGEQGLGVACDGVGNVYMNGYTSSSSNIATPGSYQPSLAGSNDAFLARFNSTGQLQWATYYGSSVNTSINPGSFSIGDKVNGGVVCDPLGHVYICGSMQGSGYATTGSFQQAIGAGNNAYLAQFSNLGVLQWATYYGGNNSFAMNTACDTLGNVYLTGIVNPTSTNVATTTAYQTTYGGAFLAKFNSVGRRQWGTYYGGPYSGGPTTFGWAINCYGPYVAYLAGITQTTTNIATPGSYQSAYGGGTSDAFLARFHSSAPSVTVTRPFTSTTLCAGNNLQLNYTVGETFQLGNVFTAQLSDAFGSFAHPVNIGSTTGIDTGNIACVIPAGTANASAYRIRIVSSYPAGISDTVAVTIANLKSMHATGSNGCPGGSITLQADSLVAGQTYHWTGPNGLDVFTRSVGILNAIYADSGNYVVVSSAGSCTQTDTVHITINAGPSKPVATSNTPICAGATINLIATTTPGASINWTGPNGFHSTQQNPVIASAPITDSGLYIIKETIGGCSVSDSIVVSVTNPIVPGVTITTSTPHLVVGYPGVFHAHTTGCTTPSYQWYRGKNPLAGKTDSVLTITLVNHDSISVVMHCSSGCIRPDSAKSNYLRPEGLINVNKKMDDIVIYPNPVTNLLIIEHAANTTASLCNVVGQTLMTKTLTSDKESINTTNIPVGTFILTIMDDEGSKQTKVMVKE